MSTFATSIGATLAYDDIGSGPPVLALHGAYSARQEIRGFLDPMLPDCRRIYPDLPGMGESTADGVGSAQETVSAVAELAEQVIGEEPYVVVGHSYGALVARGLAAHNPGRVRGMALICPLVPEAHHPEPSVVVESDGAAASLPADLVDGYTGYFVVQTTATLARFRDAVAPVLGRYDAEAVDRQMAHTTVDVGSGYPHPVLVMTGRHDAWVGYRQHAGLLDAYPRATSIVVADAGHALPHEKPEVVSAAIASLLAAVATERMP